MSGPFLLIVLALAVGWPLAELTRAEPSRSGRAGLALLLGFGTIGLVLFALSVAGISWSRVTLLTATLLQAGISFAAVLRRRPAGAAPLALPSTGSAILLGFAAVLVAGYVTFTLSGPPAEADFLEKWGLKGRTFYEAGGVDWDFLRNETTWANHPDYPPLLSLLFSGSAFLGGAWDDRQLGILYPVFGLALLLIVEASLRRRFGRDWLVGAAVVVLTPLALTPWIGMAEGPLLVYGSAGMLYVALGARESSREPVFTGAVLLGLAALTKNEGTVMIVAAALSLLITPRSRSMALRLWPALVLAAVWIVPREVFGLEGDLTAADPVGRAISRLSDPLGFLRLLAAHSSWRPLFWIGLAVGGVVGAKRLLRNEFTVTAFVAIQLLAYVGAYLVTPYELAWHVRLSWERVLSHVLFLLTAVVLASLISVVREKEPRRAQ